MQQEAFKWEKGDSICLLGNQDSAQKLNLFGKSLNWCFPAPDIISPSFSHSLSLSSLSLSWASYGGLLVKITLDSCFCPLKTWPVSAGCLETLQACLLQPLWVTELVFLTLSSDRICYQSPRYGGGQGSQLRGQQSLEDCSRGWVLFFPLKKDFKGYQVAPFQTGSRNTRGCSCRRKVDKVESWSRGWREEAIFSILKGYHLNLARKNEVLGSNSNPLQGLASLSQSLTFSGL